MSNTKLVHLPDLMKLQPSNLKTILLLVVGLDQNVFTLYGNTMRCLYLHHAANLWKTNVVGRLL